MPFVSRNKKKKTRELRVEIILWILLKMRLTCVVLLGVIVSSTIGSWIGDMTSPRGLSFGDGVSLKVEDTKAKNSSVLERLALRVDNENVGITMAQNEKKKAVQLDFYVKDKVEGENGRHSY